LSFLFKIDGAFEIVGATSVKINQILSKIANSINEQQAIQMIKDENKKMEHALVQLFGDSSSPIQPTTTSFSGSL